MSSRQASTILVIVGILVTVSVSMWPLRPLVDYKIADTYSQNPPLVLDFHSGPLQLQFMVRNRGTSDAPISARVVVINGYVSGDLKSMSVSEMLLESKVEANMKEYASWIFYIKPIDGASEMKIDFSVTRRFSLDISGIANSLWGEYNAWNTPLTYVNAGQGVYKLK